MALHWKGRPVTAAEQLRPAARAGRPSCMGFEGGRRHETARPGS